MNLQVAELTASFVKIPSMNPMGRIAPENGFGEANLAQRVGEILSALGAEVSFHYPLPGRPNVVARFDIAAPATILFEAHLDTVPSDGMTISPFSGEICDGRLYGRGSADEKGPMAAMICAIERAVQSGLRYNILFAAVCDEEYQFHGIHSFLQSLPAEERARIRFAVVAEPTLLNPVYAHKGVVRWRAVANGIAAHSSTPHLGKNAIYRMAHFISRLQKYAAALESTAPVHESLGCPTLSVGTIRGGTAVNIVPDFCEIEVDRRLIPGELPESATAQIEAIAQECEIQISAPIVRAPAFEVDVESPAVKACMSAATCCGLTPQPLAVNYCTDAAFYAQSGISAVVFGPGSIAQAHTSDEWISMEQLELGVQAYTSILQG
jgi:acetylornithine deacetylase